MTTISARKWSSPIDLYSQNIELSLSEFRLKNLTIFNCNMLSSRQITKLLIILTAICGSCAYSISSVARQSLTTYRKIGPALRALANDDDDDRPKLSMREENDGPAMSVKSFEEIKKGSVYTPSKEKSSEPRKVVKPSVSFGKGVFGSMSVEDLKSRGFVRESVQKVGFVAKKEDLNGIQPLTPLTFSVLPAAMSWVFWQITTYMTGHFAIEYTTSDLYPVQRLATVARNFVVGITTLASGFTGVISIGLFLLGITVAIGVAKGELDPNNEKVEVKEDTPL